MTARDQSAFSVRTVRTCSPIQLSPCLLSLLAVANVNASRSVSMRPPPKSSSSSSWPTGKMNDADYINLDEPGELSAESHACYYMLGSRLFGCWRAFLLAPCVTRRCCTAVWQPSSIKCVNEGAYAGAFVD